MRSHYPRMPTYTNLLVSLVVGVVLAMPARAQELMLNQDEPRAGKFLGPQGEWLEVDAVYVEHFARGSPHHLRHAAWQAGILGLGAVWYWSNLATNSTDWEFNTAEFAERFTVDAMRFDNNHFTINHLAHPVAGGGYYLAARVHDYGLGYSALISIAMSALWEAGLEWRERISLNDMMFTPGAGIAMGEAYYRLSHYLNSAPDGGNWAHKTLGWVIGWPVAVNRWIDGKQPVGDELYDDLGLSAAYAHRFRLAYQNVSVDDPEGAPGTLHGLHIESEMVAIPGFQRPGKLAIVFDDGNFTEFDVSMLWNEKGEAAQLDLWFDSAVWGFYQQNFEGPPEAITGFAGTLALSFAFEHVQRWLPGPRDRRAVLHLPGGRLGIWSAYKGLVHSLQVGLHPDFSSIDSLAFPLWKAENPRTLGRSVLEDRGYYFGWGGTTWVSTGLKYRGLEIDAKVRLTFVNSIEGNDRHQEEIDYDGDFEDSLTEFKASIGYSDPTWLLSARVEGAHIERVGRANGLSAQRAWNQLALTTGFQF